MRVFLDFEASSLSDDSYPIEIGWVFEDGRSEGHLIKPAPHWTEWSVLAETTHKIPRETLMERGSPHDVVAHRVIDALSGHTLFASAPSWDGKWLSVLLRSAGLPRHALRLHDTDVAIDETVRPILAATVPPSSLEAAVRRLIATANDFRQPTAAHRAVEDAERERQLWLIACRLAKEEAGLT